MVQNYFDKKTTARKLIDHYPKEVIRKIEILKKIMHDDRVIRDTTQPWMNKLQALIHNTGTRRNLEQRYGAS